MSVVNQMLRDLDRRQADPNTPVYAQHVGSGPAPTNWLLIILLCVVVASATAALMYFFRDRDTPPATPPAVVSAPPRAVTTVAPVQPIEPQTTTAVVATTAAPVIIETPPPAAAPVREARSPAAANPPREPQPEAPAQAPVESAASNKRIAAAPVETSAKPAPAPVENTLAAAPKTKTPQTATAGTGQIDMRPSALSAQSADGEYRRAVVLVNQARVIEAREALATALKMDARHDAARQTLAVLMIDAGLLDDAEAVLSDGLRLAPTNANLAIVLARVKVERKDLAGALNVLKQHGGAAADNAQYRGFNAALLQRAGRHAEAIEEYRAAVRLVPSAGVWWMGLGLSYEANEQRPEALDAFSRARDTGSLTPDVAGFVERKVQSLR